MTVLVVAELVQIEPLLRDAVASSGLIVHDSEHDLVVPILDVEELVWK